MIKMEKTTKCTLELFYSLYGYQIYNSKLWKSIRTILEVEYIYNTLRCFNTLCTVKGIHSLLAPCRIASIYSACSDNVSSDINGMVNKKKWTMVRLQWPVCVTLVKLQIFFQRLLIKFKCLSRLLINFQDI